MSELSAFEQRKQARLAKSKAAQEDSASQTTRKAGSGVGVLDMTHPSATDWRGRINAGEAPVINCRTRVRVQDFLPVEIHPSMPGHRSAPRTH
jgi:hypothetical protein